MTNLKLRMLTVAISIASVSNFFSSCEKKDVASSTTTLRSKEIILIPVTGSTVAGKAVFAENADHSTNIQITLENTVKDTIHVMHIHNGGISSPGNIAIPLSDIKGTGGQATGTTLNIKTATSPGGAVVNISYDSLVTYAGYVNVHYSTAQTNRSISNGNIK